MEPVFFATHYIRTFDGETGLTTASGFLFSRDGRLFLVTSKHVVIDEANGHHPTRLVINFHTSEENLTLVKEFSIPLYKYGMSLWRAASDSAGMVDIAVVEIDTSALPADAIYHPFLPQNIPSPAQDVPIGSDLLTVGYPMGFHDALHHLPVARSASLASSYGIRFKGNGYFLVDAWTHRGLSGSPVLWRIPGGAPEGSKLPWYLMGVHSARLEARTRDPEHDEVLGLNAVWYSDVLMTLTQ